MAIELSTTNKYSLKYRAIYSSDNSALRTLSGFNAHEGNSTAEKGPNATTALRIFIPTLQGFSGATLNEFKWLMEKEVTF